MDITCKFKAGVLVIESPAHKGIAGQKLHVPASLASKLYEELGKAVNVRSRVEELEKQKRGNEIAIAQLKKSEEYRNYNEELLT